MTPADVGAPARFTEWRHGQDFAFEQLLNSRKRIAVVAAPTGVGKSLIGVSFGEVEGERYAYLTSTKGLQDQVQREFAETGLADVRGAENYGCDLDEAEHDHEGEPCPYQAALRRAIMAKGALTNYAFWLVKPGRLGSRKLLVLDEGHDAADHLLGSLRLVLSEYDAAPFPPPGAELGWAEWVDWLQHLEARLDLRLQGTTSRPRKRKLRDLIARIQRAVASPEPWVVTRSRRAVTFEPVWASPYVEQSLFQEVDKVVIMSATIKPKSLEYLGLRRADYDYIQVPSPFPTGRRPVYLVRQDQGVKTPRLSAKTDIADMLAWARLIDRVVEGRPGRKGIIHTVSYDRAEFIALHSRHSARLLLHDANSTREIVEKFKASPKDEGLVLVSPSVHTGYDFPYDEAEFQIIAKVPFLDPNDPITKARTQGDADYPFFQAAARIVQASGRGMRAPDDACETFIVDMHADWLLARHRTFLPVWFNDSVRRVDAVPPPPNLKRKVQ